MAKKHNKARKQKPNYSKRGKGSFNVETASDFSPESKTSNKNPEQSEQSSISTEE